MNNIDYNKLGAIGAEAAQKAMKTWHVLTVSKNHSSWENDESARTAYAKAVVRAYLEQVGEGFPSVTDCLQAWPSSPNTGQAIRAVRSLMLAAFARKMEAVAKLPEKWRADQNGPQSVITVHGCAHEVEKALSLPAVEVEPAEKWAKEKEAHAQGRRIERRNKNYDSYWTVWMGVTRPIWENDPSIEYRIAPDQPSQPGKLTDEELGEIGAKAAFDNRSFPSSYLCIDRGNAQWSKEQDGRNAYARAVRETVEKQQGEEIARLTEDCKGLSIALDSARERLVKAEKTAESKHGCWMQELAKVTALEKQLSEALPWRESCEKWQAECEKVDAQLATVTAERDRLQWKPVSVKPTKGDADSRGCITVTNGHYSWQQQWATGIGKAVKGWRPFSPPPAPTPEDAERERFEVWYKEYKAVKSPKGIAFDVWQAARAVKEGEVV